MAANITTSYGSLWISLLSKVSLSALQLPFAQFCPNFQRPSAPIAPHLVEPICPYSSQNSTLLETPAPACSGPHISHLPALGGTQWDWACATRGVPAAMVGWGVPMFLSLWSPAVWPAQVLAPLPGPAKIVQVLVWEGNRKWVKMPQWWDCLWFFHLAKHESHSSLYVTKDILHWAGREIPFIQFSLRRGEQVSIVFLDIPCFFAMLTCLLAGVAPQGGLASAHPPHNCFPLFHCFWAKNMLRTPVQPPGDPIFLSHPQEGPVTEVSAQALACVSASQHSSTQGRVTQVCLHAAVGKIWICKSLSATLGSCRHPIAFDQPELFIHSFLTGGYVYVALLK